MASRKSTALFLLLLLCPSVALGYGPSQDFRNALTTLFSPFTTLIATFLSGAANAPHVSAQPSAIYERYIKEAAVSPSQAWADLKKEAQHDGTVAILAHDLGHIIGRATYAKAGLAGVKVCDNSFIFACYHGFVQAAMADGKTTVPDMRAACEEAAKQSQKVTGADYGYTLLSSCIHGMGHGIISADSFDVHRALAECNTIGESSFVIPDDEGGVYMDMRLSCKDGIFMEYFQGGAPGIDMAHPWNLCAGLSSVDQLPCVRYLHYGQYRWGLSLDQTVSLCLSAPTRYFQKRCFYELGFFERGFLGADESHWSDVIVHTCAAVKDDEINYWCLRAGAVTFPVQQYNDPIKNGTQVCDAARTSAYKERCMRWVMSAEYYVKGH